MTDVVALGELLIDFAQTEIDANAYPTLKANPGGAPANFLTPISKYGYKTELISNVGNDYFGRSLINTLKKNKIGTKGINVDNTTFTTLAFVTINNGDRSFSFARKPGADTNIKCENVDLSIIDKCKVFHFGTLSLTNNPSKNTTKKLVAYAKSKNKLISFDPNLRKPLWNNMEDAKEAMLYGLKNSNIVKISDDEVKFLFKKNPKDALDYILDKYKNIDLLYVTCGEKGCYYSNRNYSGFINALNNIKVVDTTGAGDIFGGSAMYKLLDKRKQIKDLDDLDIKDIVKFATVAAGLSTTTFGGISSVPDIEDVKKAIKKLK